MRAIVVYDSWYGDTRRVAEEVARAIAESTGDDPGVVEVDHAGPGSVREFDLIVLGTPNHFGGPTRKIRQFVRDLGSAGPVAARFGVFDTCFAAEEGKASQKLVELVRSIQPAGAPSPPHFSSIVEATRGPIRSGELLRAHRFGLALARRGPDGRVPVPA